jgi:hypothetical protein
MNISELKSKLNGCHFMHEVIDISRTWYWVGSTLEYSDGVGLIVDKANELNTIYKDVKSVLILRSEV